jgi:hypothetical protein
MEAGLGRVPFGAGRSSVKHDRKSGDKDEAKGEICLLSRLFISRAQM